MVIVLKHVPYEGPGLIEEMLEGRGVPFRIIEVDDEGVPHAPAGFTGIVSMGGPMSVNDGTRDMLREKTLLAEAVSRKIPVLGICLGAQMIASALGSKIYKGPRSEVGWGEVTLTGEGLSDPLLGGLDPVLPVLHWHSETWEVPEGAVNLAYSEHFESQAFRVGSNVYGLQFHLETDKEMVLEWIRKDREQPGGIVEEPDRILEGIDTHLDRVRFCGYMLFGRFLDLVAGRGSG